MLQLMKIKKLNQVKRVQKSWTYKCAVLTRRSCWKIFLFLNLKVNWYKLLLMIYPCFSKHLCRDSSSFSGKSMIKLLGGRYVTSGRHYSDYNKDATIFDACRWLEILIFCVLSTFSIQTWIQNEVNSFQHLLSSCGTWKFDSFSKWYRIMNDEDTFFQLMIACLMNCKYFIIFFNYLSIDHPKNLRMKYPSCKTWNILWFPNLDIFSIFGLKLIWIGIDWKKLNGIKLKISV